MSAQLIVAIGICVIGIICYLLSRHWEKKENNTDDNLTDNPQTQPHNSHGISIWDIKTSPKGRYSWDENGCVFEVNDDGSVTYVGTYDINELEASTAAKLYQRMTDEGLTEMMPEVWSFLGRTSEWTLMLNYHDTCIHAVIADDSAKPWQYLTDDKLTCRVYDSNISPLLEAVCEAGHRSLILMPSNEREYILALGAQACLSRIFCGEIEVCIYNPSVMGAFHSALQSDSSSPRVTFACGRDENYTCCNLSFHDGGYTVDKLQRQMFILPANEMTAIRSIASGALTVNFIQEGITEKVTLTTLVEYPVSLRVYNGNRIVKTLNFFDPAAQLPVYGMLTGVEINHDESVSFFIGENQIIDDILENLGDTTHFRASVTIEAHGVMTFTVEANGQSTFYNIGELIG